MTFLLANWRLVLAGLAVVFIAGLLFYAQVLRSKNLELTQTLERAEARAAAFGAALVANRAALASRSKDLEALAKEKGAILAELEKVYGVDAEARDWSSGFVPASVCRVLRR
jgi:Tfp pilus assembly protein PilN